MDVNSKIYTTTAAVLPGSSGGGKPTIRRILSTLRSNFSFSIKQGDFIGSTFHFGEAAVNFFNFVIKRNYSAECPCCGWRGTAFISLASAFHRKITFNSICPGCSSRSRHRGLTQKYKEILTDGQEGKKAILFAPEKIIIDLFAKSFPVVQLKTTDLFITDVDFPNQDIQKLSFPDASFDYVLCNHVLEHVPNDEDAIHELARILKPGGKAIITIPGDFPKYKTNEFPEPEPVNGHYRHYGMEVVEKMNRHFSDVKVDDMSLHCPPEFKVRRNDIVFICTR